MFPKSYFDEIHELIAQYFQAFRGGKFTLMIRAYGREYHVAKFIKIGNDVLTFSFYDIGKAQELLSRSHAKAEEPKVAPAISIPYHAIELVEFNPGKATENPKIGFNMKER